MSQSNVSYWARRLLNCYFGWKTSSDPDVRFQPLGMKVQQYNYNFDSKWEPALNCLLEGYKIAVSPLQICIMKLVDCGSCLWEKSDSYMRIRTPTRSDVMVKCSDVVVKCSDVAVNVVMLRSNVPMFWLDTPMFWSDTPMFWICCRELVSEPYATEILLCTICLPS